MTSSSLLYPAVILFVIAFFLKRVLKYVLKKRNPLAHIEDNKYKGFGQKLAESEEPLPAFPQHEIPMEEGGQFVQSFDISETKQYLEFFEKYGFVVIKDVLSKEQLRATIEEIWAKVELADGSAETLEALDFISYQYKQKYKEDFKPVNRKDPHSWISKHGWPGGEQVGMLGSTVCVGEQAMNNRQNEKIYQAFKQIYGLEMPKEQAEKLWVSFDRYGIMRPTKNIPVPYEIDLLNPTATTTSTPKEVIPERIEWKTASNWLHWDLNPWKLVDPEFVKLKNTKYVASENDLSRLAMNPQAYFITENNDTVIDPMKLQGLLNLVDSRESDGGFMTVPCYKQYVTEWATQTIDSIGQTKGNFVNIPKRDPMINQVRKVPMRAGSLLIWDSRQPHCNFPNDSERFRMVQYLKMFPSREADAGLQKLRAKQVKEMLLPPNFTPSELGKKVLGLECY